MMCGTIKRAKKKLTAWWVRDTQTDYGKRTW